MNKRTEAEARIVHDALDIAIELLDMHQNYGQVENAFEAEMSPIAVPLKYAAEFIGRRDDR